MVAVASSNPSTPSGSPEAAIFQRKWHTASTPAAPLPPYEDIVLGGLGRLGEHLVLIEQQRPQESKPHAFKVLRCGRALWDWIGSNAEQKLIDELPQEFAHPLQLVLDQALASGEPVTQHSRRVRGGMVETFEFLALPMSCRWGITLIAAHVIEVGTPFNLVDTIFRSTEEGILALAAVRDAAGQPSDFQIVAFNAGAARLVGCSEEELRWSYLSGLGGGLDTPAMRRHLATALATGQHQQFELSLNGQEEHQEIHLSVGVAAAGDLISATLTDVTGIREREDSFRLLFDGNPMPMWLYDSDTLAIKSVNDAAIVHYGYSRERFASMTLLDVWPKDEHDLHRAVAHAVGTAYASDHTWRHIKADGSEIEVLTYARRLVFGGKPAVLVAVVDVTERKQAEARIAYLAQHDALTGLPNRTLFHAHLKEALDGLQRTSRPLAVHCIDLDHFKSVNDTLGHPVGDELLRAVAERLKRHLNETSLVARLGGDEFAVIQTDVTHPDEASGLAAKLISAVSAPYNIQGHEVIVGASIGIALAPGDGNDCDALLRNADMALYRAKADGRGAAHFFEPEMDRRIQARRVLELDLRKAYANGEFELFYQPLINLAENRISGFEALLRWRHPKRGMVSPGEFVPLAEEIGLIVPLGEWVLRQACTEAARWPDDLHVAVNLSPVQFRNKSVVQAVMTALAYSRLEPRRLELEITESVLLADTEANLATLHKLREIGVRISMDDFGTGYSSLSYLRSFPFDKIKIDRSFVNDLTRRPDCMAIIHAVVGLGESLGISTTAEGVETREQLERLRAEGCTEAQGFLFSAPCPASEIGRLIEMSNPRAKVA
jgi:diguanylate cyclase (GGDEF)-like protein/PAS domain S-box-containing protein